MGFSRQEYWSGLPFPSPGVLPNPGTEPLSSTLQVDSLPSEPPGKPSYSLELPQKQTKKKFLSYSIWSLWIIISPFNHFSYSLNILYSILQGKISFKINILNQLILLRHTTYCLKKDDTYNLKLQNKQLGFPCKTEPFQNKKEPEISCYSFFF